jgi:hypothetical protein
MWISTWSPQKEAATSIRKSMENEGAAVGSGTDSMARSADRLAAPADADHYGVGGTDLQAVAAVDAIGRPVSQALAV